LLLIQHVAVQRSLHARGIVERSPVKAKQFAFAAIVNGARVKQMGNVLRWCGFHPPSRSSVYNAQSSIFEHIRRQCLADCEHWRNQMSNQSVISFDGSWSHRRHAKEHIVVVIDCRQKKIVDFDIRVMAKGKVPGNYRGSPNGMEMAALTEIIRRWSRHQWYLRLAGCVHDNDGKATTAVERANWSNVKQY
jgi:hypothetical protein